MKPETRELLAIIVADPVQQELWISSHNLAFDMSPARMIQLGREDEVYSYLHFNAYGPY